MDEDRDFVEQLIRRRRPSNEELLAELLRYRAVVRARQTTPAASGSAARERFALFLDLCVWYATAGHVFRQPKLAALAKDIADRTWDRLLAQEFADREFLYGYREGGGKSVYSWAWQSSKYAVLDVLRKPGDPNDVSLTEFDEADADADDFSPRVWPVQLSSSETPLRESRLRVAALKPWLARIADDMPDSTLNLPAGSGKVSTVVMGMDHKRIWIKWLALNGDHHLFDLPEAALAQQMGIAKVTLQRYVAEAYGYMLAHPDFRANLDLMIPNRQRGTDRTDKELREGLVRHLTGPDGKSDFRSLVHTWVAWHLAD